MPTCFKLLHFDAYLYFSAVTKQGYLLSLSSTNSLRPVDAYMCQEFNLAFVKTIVFYLACLIGAESFSK